MMGVQIVEIAGEKMAVLPVADYERLVDAAEDKADIAAGERAEQRRIGGEEYIPFEMVERMVNGEAPLRVWREHRGMSQLELARASGVSNNMICNIELGRREGKLAKLRALSEALNISVEDLLPTAS